MSARLLIAALAVLTAALFVASLQLGPVSLSPGTVLSALLGKGDLVDVLIVRELRLPRAILAALIGATLALCGAALQGLVRNPLAAPSVFGAPSAAAFGAVLAIGTGLADTLSYSLPIAAMMGALLSVGALLALAGPSANMLTLLLAGLALSSLAGALVSLALNLAPNPYAARACKDWSAIHWPRRRYSGRRAPPLSARCWRSARGWRIRCLTRCRSRRCSRR